MRAFCILLTVVALAGCERQAEEPTSFVVKCEEPLPEFTLGADSNPNDTQVATLCSCIWENLGDWEKETAQAYAEGREPDVSALKKRAFPYRFGRALQRCDGMDL